jgi:hypothetical protein
MPSASYALRTSTLNAATGSRVSYRGPLMPVMGGTYA